MNETRKSDKHRIQIVCDAASHPKKIVKVCRFELNRHWHEGPDAGVWRLVNRGQAAEHLIDDTLLDPGEVYGSWQRPPRMELMDLMRVRLPMTCSLCGLRKTVRHETLLPVLQAAADQGVSELRLSFLAATL